MNKETDTQETIDNHANDAVAEQMQASSKSIKWKPVIPFTEKQELPPFPIEALPTICREHCEAVAEAMQAAIDMVATTLLTLIALCVQDKYVVAPNEDWIEQLNLYALMILSPSERKSAVLNELIKPIDKVEEILNERLAEVRKKGEQAAGQPVYIRLYQDDVTPEELIQTMSRQNGRGGIISTEGGWFNLLAGRYNSHNVNIDAILKAYTGDKIIVDRISRAGCCISHPILTVCLMAQPIVLQEVGDGGDHICKDNTKKNRL